MSLVPSASGPKNAPAAFALTCSETGYALVLACDRQRGFKPDDIAWARAVAARLGEVIDGAM